MRRTRAGFFSFTGITDPAAHRAYNEWHMLDHMPEQFAIPGVALGQRWVHTPAAAAGAIALPPFDSVHYLTLYLMTDPLDETLEEFVALGRHLHDVGDRWFDARLARVTGPWSVHAMAAAPRVKVRAGVIPARPHRAIEVRAGAQLDDAADLTALCERDGVAGAWSFAPNEVHARRRRGAPDVAITIAWIDGPIDGKTRDQPIAREHDVFATTFETITPWQWGWFDPPPKTAERTSNLGPASCTG